MMDTIPIGNRLLNLYMKILPEIPKLLRKIKDSQMFWVELPIDLKIKYIRNIPFTIAIGPGVLLAYVLAYDQNEAYEKVYDYLNSVDDNDIMEQ